MALMFARLARNFIKNGYFPTDERTLSGVIALLRCSPGRAFRMLDPCCGEGCALADVRQGLLNHVQDDAIGAVDLPEIEALGVEVDRERAWHAKRHLSRVLHADLHDVIVRPRSIGLMFLNPPYGYGVSDQANRNASEMDREKAERLERTFLRKATPLVAYGGILVYIIPFYAIDDDIAVHLARNYEDLRVFMSPERQFKQCVVIGRRRRSGHPAREVLEMFLQAREGEQGAPALLEASLDAPYQVPATEAGQESDFHAVRIDAAQLADELQRLRSDLLWPGLETHFSQAKATCRPPLRDMTPWHLALSLAAGQITGRIRSSSGREFLIKGDTFKSKSRTVTTDVDDKGNAHQTIVMLDKFVPVINAIELTQDERLGQIVKIA